MPDITFSTKGAGKLVITLRCLRALVYLVLCSKEAQKLGQVEQRILRETETARERYNRKMTESKKALAGNAREVDLLSRVEGKLRADFARTATEAEKRALAVKVANGKATADERKLHAAVQVTGTKFGQVASSIAGAFNPVKLAGYAAGFVGIHQVVSAITSELRAQQEMIDKRNAKQITVSESRNQVLRNLIGSTPAEINATSSAATGIAAKTGISEVAINTALADTISATGDPKLSLSLVRRAAKFLFDRPQEIGDFAGALGDLTRVTGSTDPNVSLGLLAQIGPLSRISSPALTAKNAAPALIGVLPFGGDAVSGGALFSAITTGSADTTGEKSRTATISLAQQLHEASLGEGTFGQKGFFRGQIGGDNLLERIRSLQANPALAKRFLDAGSFERGTVGPITQLLTDPQSAIRRDFDTALSKIGSTDQLRKLGTQVTDIFKFNRLETVAGRGRTLQSVLEQLQVRKASDRLSTDELTLLKDISLETGGSSIGAGFDRLIGRVSGGGTVRSSEAINLLERRARELENPAGSPTMIGGAGEGAGFLSRPREATPEEKESARLLREAVEQLKQQTGALKRMGDKEGGILVGND